MMGINNYSQTYQSQDLSLLSSSIATDSLDWPFLDSIDPILLQSKENIHILKQISRLFVRTTISSLGSAPRMLKLFQILQIIISRISKDYEKNKEKIEDLHSKINSLKRSNQKLLKKPKTINQVAADKCPICFKPFKLLPYLDLHIFTKHQEVATLWQAIRTPQPQGAFAFPWVKSHTMTSTMYPPSNQSTNDQSIQNTMNEFRQILTDRQKASERETQELINRKMSKIESRIEDLEQTAKMDGNYERNNMHHKSRKHKSPHRQFDPEQPYKSNKQVEIPDQFVINSPGIGINQHNSIISSQTNLPKVVHRDSSTIEDGEINLNMPLGDTGIITGNSLNNNQYSSNSNFQSLTPKNKKSESDAEYLSAPSNRSNHISASQQTTPKKSLSSSYIDKLVDSSSDYSDGSNGIDEFHMPDETSSGNNQDQFTYNGKTNNNNSKFPRGFNKTSSSIESTTPNELYETDSAQDQFHKNGQNSTRNKTSPQVLRKPSINTSSNSAYSYSASSNQPDFHISQTKFNSSNRIIKPQVPTVDQLVDDYLNSE